MTGLRAEGVRTRHVGPCNLAVSAGECVTLSGPSGSGQTLLLRALADLDPHQGRVWLDDKEQHAMSGPEWRRWVAYLPGESHWWAPQVGDHFEGDVSELLVAVGFEPACLGWEVSRLSAGERQRLALVRLLAIRPRALLLDEPTANLDNDNTLKVEALVTRYLTDHHAPVLWVSHSPQQERRIARRHLRMDQGRLTERTPDGVD